MLMAAALSVLVGMALGQRFKIWVLPPILVLTIFLAIVAALMGVGVWAAAAASLTMIVGFQVGYLLGIGLRYLMAVGRANRLRRASSGGLVATRSPAH
jgi:hypothetical protein